MRIRLAECFGLQYVMYQVVFTIRVQKIILLFSTDEVQSLPLQS